MPFAGSDWFDPLEEAVRGQVRAFIEQLLDEELEAALGRGRYRRGAISSGGPIDVLLRSGNDGRGEGNG